MYTEIKSYCESRGVKLLVVSKMRSREEIETIYNQGQREFAENRVQDLLNKKEELPQDIQWHLIGNLQRNKVKAIASFISLIHSLDELKLWEEIHRHAVLNDRIIPCLLQIKISPEESKFGFSFEELIQVLDQDYWRTLQGVSIQGVMGMASLTNDEIQIKTEFENLKKYFDQLKSSYFKNDSFNTLSMGMSGDYKIAIDAGSTLVRIGSKVFES